MKPPTKLAKVLAEAMGAVGRTAPKASTAAKSLSSIDFNADMSPADIKWVLSNVEPNQLSEQQKELMYWASSVDGNLSDAVDYWMDPPSTPKPNGNDFVPTPNELDAAASEMVSLIEPSESMSLDDLTTFIENTDPVELTDTEVAALVTAGKSHGPQVANLVMKWLKEGPTVKVPPEVDVTPYMVKPGSVTTETPVTFGPSPEQAADMVNDMLRTGRASEITDELYGIADPKRLREGYDLSLDPASREQRRLEHWPGVGYHYTKADRDFQVPNTGANYIGSDAGFHFGTMASARDRGVAHMLDGEFVPKYSHTPVTAAEYDEAQARLARGETFTIERNGMPVEIKSMRDLNTAFGVAGNPQYPENSRVLQLAYDPSAFTKYDADAGSWLPYPLQRQSGESFSDNPELQEALRKLVGEQAQRRAYMTTLPEVAQAYGFRPEDFQTQEGITRLAGIEVDEMRKTLDAYGVKGLQYPNRVEGLRGEDSFVAFQPGVVRSKTAIFDPRLKHLGNMMAAGAPVALTYGMQSPEE